MVKVGVVMVLYNPDFEVTKKALSSLASQVDQICVVDNSPSDHSEVLGGYESVEYKPLLKNVGIAAAQNIGIRHFIDLGYDFVLFSDQDSIASEKVVSKLLENYQALQKKGIKVGAVGTRAINRQSGMPYGDKSKMIARFSKETFVNSSDITEYYSVISSISLISRISLLDVGGFDESLFIDGVDHEWCWRAWHKSQWRSFVVEDAKVNHQLGEGDKKVASRSIAIASPFRMYYQFRNYLWLCRRDYVPGYWKKKNGVKYLVKLFYFPICIAPRAMYLKHIIHGVIRGLNPVKSNWPIFLILSSLTKNLMGV